MQGLIREAASKNVRTPLTNLAAPRTSILIHPKEHKANIEQQRDAFIPSEIFQDRKKHEKKFTKGKVINLANARTHARMHAQTRACARAHARAPKKGRSGQDERGRRQTSGC